MKQGTPAATPEAYVSGLSGWKSELVVNLRNSVLAASELEEVVKWGHLVYLSNGPVLFIRAEDERVYFGFWRGKRLRDLEPRLKASGKYEMAKVELREGDEVGAERVRRLVSEGVELNQRLGDPRLAAKRAPKRESGGG